MKKYIVTGFSADGFKQYGKRLTDGLLQFNSDFEVLVYGTDYIENQELYRPLLKHPNLYVLDQNDISQLEAFTGFHKYDPMWCGKLSFVKWNDKERKAGYSYRFDAVKFCRMVFTMWDAAKRIEEGYMVWLDGDNVVRKQIPSDLCEKSLNECDYAYLGREPKHTETGYLVFKLPEALPILTAWAEYYSCGTFSEQKEWHSAFLFDRAREQFPEIKGHNLTPGGRGHVIHKCWVGQYFDHCKGNRKNKGKSPEAK